MSLRVVVVDEHGALREGLELLLAREGFEVAGSTDDPVAAATLVSAEHPDVVLVGATLQGEGVAELTRGLIKDSPDVAVLLYAEPRDIERLRQGLGAGARGCALKQGSARELVDAIREVAHGRPYLDPRLGPAQLSRRSDERAVLSPREREILGLLARGLTGRQIAVKLFLSPETVRTHVRNATEKLDAHTRTHAVMLALKRGEISVD